ncbi:MAG: hypothetical protein PVI59_01695 [Anaerolineae bacterium]
MTAKPKRVVLLLLIVLLAGCRTATEPFTAEPSPSPLPTLVSPLSPPATPSAPSALPSPTVSPLAIPSVEPGKTLPPASERARNALATRLNVDPATIEVVGVTRQEMPMLFLGCPPEGTTPRADPPGMVIGEQIILRHAGTDYVYHAHQVQLFYCGER